MDIKNLVLLLLVFLDLYLGFLVLKKDYKNEINVSYFLYVLWIIIWTLGIVVFRSTNNYAIMLVANYVFIISAGLIFSSLLHFSYVFVYEKNKLNGIYKLLIYLPNIFIFWATITQGVMVRGVVVRDWGNESLLGWAYFYYGIYISIIALLSFFNFWIKYKKSHGVLKQQIFYIILGLFISLVFGSIFNLIFILFGNYKFIWLGPYASFIMLFFTGYAILRYRFLDIRVVIKRSLIFTVLVLLITSIFSASAFFLSSFVQTFFGQNSILVSGAITGVLVAIGFEPIKLWLTRVTDSVLFKGQVDPQVALSRASTKISALLDVRKLGEVIANTAYEVLKFDKLKVYIFDEVVQGYRLVHKVGQGGSQDLTQDNLIYQYYQIYEQDIQNKQIIAIDELRYLVTQTQDEFLTQLVAYMEQHHIALVVPLYIKNEALGFIFLGEKKSGDPYTNEDLNFLHILGAQAGISFKNAKLYEEQLKFADTLQQEVDKATKELKSANKELKKLDQAKSEFISIASHQLRTPMTAIKGYMSMVEDGDFGQVPDKIQKPVHAVLESSNRLLRLIEDLLNISRIESGRMQYEFEMGNMQRLVESVFEELQNHAKKKNLKFVYHAPQEPIPDIPMDTMKIREVVMNLADNAIKYTDTGMVELFLEVKGNEVKYWVKDTGRGLTAEDKGKLFKKFSRVGSSQLVHTEGTGLGLYIAKQIIKKHKGKLWAESEGAMKGSVFALSLKIKNPELEQLIDNTAVSLDRDIVKKQMNEPMEDTIDMSRIKIRKDRKSSGA